MNYGGGGGDNENLRLESGPWDLVEISGGVRGEYVVFTKKAPGVCLDRAKKRKKPLAKDLSS